MAWQLYQGDALETLKQMEDESINCCVTSPPYWGLRDYGCDGQMGLESSPDEYVSKMVEVFREVKRVLRDDGTLWLNLGDSYSGSCQTGGVNSISGNGKSQPHVKHKRNTNLKPKDLVGIPWMVAFALRADGWWLRSDIIWAKGNPMPESVTDRPTKAHEYIFLLSKSSKYYYDADSIREPLSVHRAKQAGQKVEPGNDIVGRREQIEHARQRGSGGHFDGHKWFMNPLGRNKRSVWTITTKTFKEAHFAVFPPEIPETCIKAGTSEKGCCPKCGSPWERVVERKRLKRNEFAPSDPRYRPNAYQGAYGDINGKGDAGYIETSTIGWQPTCTCGINKTVPCTVLDPFAGAGTTLWVAEQLGVNSIGIELNPDYCDIIRRRMAGLEVNLFQNV